MINTTYAEISGQISGHMKKEANLSLPVMRFPWPYKECTPCGDHIQFRFLQEVCAWEAHFTKPLIQSSVGLLQTQRRTPTSLLGAGQYADAKGIGHKEATGVIV